ncbi:MAG: YqgE/AlgH family protein [Gammaproteobacteria bacterium]|nr:YqgE/AlgH family protein [Gammaproteobacteria bacterium]
METNLDLTNQFLIAMPTLQDPNFSHTVTYLCEHHDDGYMGVIINRPSPLNLSNMCDQLDIPIDDPDIATIPLYYGGPVEIDRGLVLHRDIGEWENTLPITPDIGLTMSLDIIDAIASGMGPKEFIIILGYAGWGEGQLEDELSENVWLNGPADEQIIFNTAASEKWNQAAAILGVNLQNLSSEIGHA